MKETRYKANPGQPYGLHDCRIDGIELENDNLRLVFRDGITCILGSDAPDLKVHGSIVVEAIDFDFCSIIIQGKGGSTGIFRGERLTIPEFTEKYKGFLFEITDEYYGWQRLQYAGWLWMPGARPKEMTLSLGYFKGDIVYYTEEQ